MNYGSVCSGIEAASVAWLPLGWKPVFFSEIDKFPSAVLKHHHPGVPNAGDFTSIQDGDYDPIDLLVGGTPCQDFSVAGLRAGMDGARGQLTVEFAHLAGRLRPRWLVWENVPGVLSIDGGRAFGTFIGLLGKLGYGVAYRVLDAQYCGVPQRRRRVFVVGYFGDWRCAAAVLLERHSLSGYPPPRREKGQGFTHDLAPSLTGSGRGTERTGESRGQDPVVAVQTASTGEVSHCLNAGGMGRQDYETETETETVIVTHALRADGFDASEDGTGRGTPLVVALQAGSLRENPDSGPDGVGVRTDGVAYTLEARSEVQACAYSVRTAQTSSNGWGIQEEVTHTLDQAQGIAVALPMAVRRLTPKECERLQGFPDDYTKINDKTTDGPRYKALGNSMAVPVMRWIGERIDMVEQIVRAA